MQKIFKDPPPWLLIIAYFLTFCLCAASIVVVSTGHNGAISYIIFALSAIALAYSVYTVVCFHSQIKRFFKGLINKLSFTKKYANNPEFRARVRAITAFLFSVLFGILNGILGIVAESLWYGALSLYYIITAVIYSLLFDIQNGTYRAYRLCGCLMTFLNVALSIAIAQMIFEDKAFEYGDIMVFVFATYAFYKITVSIIRLVKSRGQINPVTSALALIGLTNGAVTILALQTALLSSFGGSANASLFNTLTGSAVSLLAIGTSVYMIINGTKKIKSEKLNERK